MPHGGELQSPSPVVSTISLAHIVPCTLEPPILVLVIFPLDVSLLYSESHDFSSLCHRGVRTEGFEGTVDGSETEGASILAPAGLPH